VVPQSGLPALGNTLCQRPEAPAATQHDLEGPISAEKRYHHPGCVLLCIALNEYASWGFACLPAPQLSARVLPALAPLTLIPRSSRGYPADDAVQGRPPRSAHPL
jgi:hypothetical protein